MTGRLAKNVDERKLFISGLLTSIIGSAALLLSLTFDLGLFAVCASLFIIVSSVGIVTTTGFTLAMQKQEKGAGSAAALLGLLPFIGGAIAAPLVGVAGEESAWPMALSIFGFDVLAILSYVFLVRRNA
jgi:DHA1 family bicyclomycin/chloramphenicol resistance-like MFS transporter